MYEIGFINERNQRVVLKFKSEFKFSRFLNSLKHSKKCKLLYSMRG